MSEFERDIKTTAQQYQALKNLWTAKLNTMLDGLIQPVPNYTYFKNTSSELRIRRRKKVQCVQNEKHKIARWFESDKQDIGSFIWICEVLGICPKVVLRKIKAQQS